MLHKQIQVEKAIGLNSVSVLKHSRSYSIIL